MWGEGSFQKLPRIPCRELLTVLLGCAARAFHHSIGVHGGSYASLSRPRFACNIMLFSWVVVRCSCYQLGISNYSRGVRHLTLTLVRLTVCINARTRSMHCV